MPIYEFECENCGHKEEHMTTIEERPSEIVCKNCGDHVKRKISSFIFQMKIGLFEGHKG